MSAALLGQVQPRTKPLFWEYGRTAGHLKAQSESDRSPNVAIRKGRWKLLVNTDGSRAELYDLAKDPGGTRDQAAGPAALVRRLRERDETFRNTPRSVAVPFP